jgi:hypothetical protein
MNAALKKQMDEAVSAQVDRDLAWLPHDHRGRWVVIEPGAGRHLTNSPRDVRRFVDRVTPRRARRFSSLSRARAFARSVGGQVARWRSAPPGGGVWRRVSPWERALSMADAAFWLPGMLGRTEEI